MAIIINQQSASKPILDKLAIPFHLQPEDQAGAISELISRINDKTPGSYNKVKQVHGQQGYQISANVIMESAIGPSTALFIQLGCNLKGAAFGRVEFNPAKVLAGGLLSELECELEALSPDSFYEWMHDKPITRIDLASDIKHVNINNALLTAPGFARWDVKGKGGSIESIYLGSVTSDKRICYYNKRLELIKHKHPDPGHDLTRVEVRLKPKGMTVASLLGMKNPFEDIALYSLPSCQRIGSECNISGWWSLFFDSCLLRGLHGALLNQPANKRPLIKDTLESGRLKCWKPSEIWSGWAEALAPLVTHA